MNTSTLPVNAERGLVHSFLCDTTNNRVPSVLFSLEGLQYFCGQQLDEHRDGNFHRSGMWEVIRRTVTELPERLITKYDATFSVSLTSDGCGDCEFMKTRPRKVATISFRGEVGKSYGIWEQPEYARERLIFQIHRPLNQTLLPRRIVLTGTSLSDKDSPSTPVTITRTDYTPLFLGIEDRVPVDAALIPPHVYLDKQIVSAIYPSVLMPSPQ